MSWANSGPVRYLDLAAGDKPCAKSAGQWRIARGTVAVCRACTNPPITCYADLAQLVEKPRKSNAV